jgi:hypothetical protein
MTAGPKSFKEGKAYCCCNTGKRVFLYESDQLDQFFITIRDSDILFGDKSIDSRKDQWRELLKRRSGNELAKMVEVELKE